MMFDCLSYVTASFIFKEGYYNTILRLCKQYRDIVHSWLTKLKGIESVRVLFQENIIMCKATLHTVVVEFFLSNDVSFLRFEPVVSLSLQLFFKEMSSYIFLNRTRKVFIDFNLNR